MSTAENHAVFLSYASQDAAAVLRIAEALRAVGVEVWFDKDELVGGDAWDAKIRGQIGACALFVPVISAATQARLEGYFRIEWKLAAQRTHGMAEAKAFLLPVVIDATRDAEAHVPGEFRAVQWTRLPGGEAAEKFCARVKTLLGGEVAPVSDRRAGSAQAKQTDAGQRPALRRKRSVRRGLGLAGLGVAAVVALTVWQPWRGKVAAKVDAAPSVSALVGSNEKSLVVLPFENLSPDPENAFFTDGMHAEVSTTLAQIPDLKVISRNSALVFKDSKLPLAEIAQKLGVANVITGSVRRVGNTVRIQLELRRARDEALLWSLPKGDREFKDTLGLQSDIADQVARVLQARAATGVHGVAKFMTKNPEAYDLFLKQQAVFFEGFKPNSKKKFSEAIRIGQEAFALDSSFMSAAQFVSVANAILYGREDDPTRRATYAAESRRWAETAARLAPGGVGDLAMVSHLYYVERDFVRAVAMAENGVRALPNDSGMRNFLALAQHALGRTTEAAENFKKALTGDPLSPVLNLNLLGVLTDLRQTEPASAVVARLEALSPTDNRAYIAEARFQLRGEIPPDLKDLSQDKWLWRARHYGELAGYAEGKLAQPNVRDADRFWLLSILSEALDRRGDSTGAMAAAQKALALAEKLRREPVVTRRDLDIPAAWSLVRVGRRDEAVATAQRAVDARAGSDLGARWQSETGLAAVLARAGRPQQCVELLAKLLRVPSGLTVPMLKVDPTWDNVREDAAFKALLADPKNSAPL